MNLISEDYLMHHGVKGMKWGVRRDKRNIFANRYRSHNIAMRNRNRAIEQEGNKLINKSKGLKRDFGSYKNVDDEEYFEFIARTQYNLNTSNYWNHVSSRNTYLKNLTKNDKRAIKLGKKYAKKGFGTINENDPKYM